MYIFTPNTLIESSKINANFNELYNGGFDLTSLYQASDSSYTTQAAVSAVSSNTIRRWGGLLCVTMSMTLASAVDDTTTDLVQLVLGDLGVGTITGLFPVGYADGGNAITQMSVTTSGMIRSVGNEPAGLAIADAISVSFVTPITGYA